MLGALSYVIDGLYISGYYCLTLAEKYSLTPFLGHEMNVANSAAVSALGIYGGLLSAELTEGESRYIAKNIDGNFYYYSFGCFPLMTLAHCPMKLSFGSDCKKCAYTGREEYRDRKASFPIRRIKCGRCYFKLNNSVPHVIAKDISPLGHYYDLTARGALNDYKAMKDGKVFAHTTGHFKKEV